MERAKSIPIYNYLCYIKGCNFRADFRDVMNNHYKDDHNELPYPCLVCSNFEVEQVENYKPVGFHNKQELERHFSIEHKNQALYCRRCLMIPGNGRLKPHKNLRTLITHIFSIHEIKLYYCDLCFYSRNFNMQDDDPNMPLEDRLYYHLNEIRNVIKKHILEKAASGCLLHENRLQKRKKKALKRLQGLH
jgi:hypothetical protein